MLHGRALSAMAPEVHSKTRPGPGILFRLLVWFKQRQMQQLHSRCVQMIQSSCVSSAKIGVCALSYRSATLLIAAGRCTIVQLFQAQVFFFNLQKQTFRAVNRLIFVSIDASQIGDA